MRKIKVKYIPTHDQPPGSHPDSCFGKCYNRMNEIIVDPRQTPPEMLDTEVHELLHVIYPYMSEENVRRGADVMSTVLWKIGYRKKK